MQRQAVPLLTTEAPVVGTGMEAKAAVDSGVCVVAKKAGIDRAFYFQRRSPYDRTMTEPEDEYHLTKFSQKQPVQLLQPEADRIQGRPM